MISSTDFQEAVIKYLEKYDIYPFSVTYTSDYNRSSDGCILGITTYIVDDIDTILELLDYKSLCDKSGFTVFRENCTIILQGMPLVHLYSLT
jgi:hypothetical protein